MVLNDGTIKLCIKVWTSVLVECLFPWMSKDLEEPICTRNVLSIHASM